MASNIIRPPTPDEVFAGLSEPQQLIDDDDIDWDQGTPDPPEPIIS